MSVIADFLVNGLNPSVVGGTGTTVKYFPALLGGFNVQSTAPSATSAAGQLGVPGNNVLNGQLFNVKAVGNFIAGSSAGSETVTVSLYANTGTVTSPSYTAIASTGAFAPPVDGVEHSFAINAELYGDTLSGIVGGDYIAYVDGLKQNSTPKDGVALTGINMGASLPFGLVVGVTFSVSNASNAAKLYTLQVQAS